MPTTQRPIDIHARHENHAASSHVRNPRTAQPRPAGISRREAEFLGQLLDGAPALERAHWDALLRQVVALCIALSERLDRLETAHASAPD